MYGTADGVYLSNLWEPSREPTKVLALQDVTQVDVLEDYQLLIVLAGALTARFRVVHRLSAHVATLLPHLISRRLLRIAEGQVITFPLDSLDPRDPMAGLRRGKRITTHISFFKCGVCLNKTLVCVVKASALSSTIKVLEPIDYATRGKNKPTFRKLLQGGHDTLRPFRVCLLHDLYEIPSSLI